MFNRWKLVSYFFLTLLLVVVSELTNIENHLVVASDRQIITNQENQPRQLLEEGITYYQQESFALARDVWLESASLYSQEQNILGEALALNNLALAYQHLGEWEQSAIAIAQSLQLLQEKSDENPEYWNILAKVFNTQGNWQWHTGDIELALDSWQKAEEYYGLAGYQLGIIKAQINQAKALQAIGLTVRAVELLNTTNDSLQESDTQLKATGLRHLGISLRNLGKLERSVETLKQGIEILENAQFDKSISTNLIWLELGNTYRKQREQALITGKEREAKEYFTQAIKAYQKAQISESLSFRSQLNQLSLLIDAEYYAEAKVLAQEIDLAKTKTQANRADIYALLNYARSITCLQSPMTSVPLCNYQSGFVDTTEADYSEGITITQEAIAQARTIQDTIAEAQALRQLAEIYELQGDLDTAYSYAQQALLLLEGKNAADIVYRLQWQLGRILQLKGNDADAAKAYNLAIASLAQVRDNILLIDPLVQFSFRDRIEPVYREYASLLLRSDGNNTISQNNLRQAIRVINALQLAELENFLGCDLSKLIRIDETTVDATAAQIYPLLLSDRLITIVEIPGKPLEYRETIVSQQQINKTILALQNNLTQPGKTPETLQQSQQLYQWAIAPIKPLLKANPQIQTLVFVPDGEFRNIPLGILYDGEQYLIEQDYALVISPQLELFAPAPSTSPLNVLTGGVEISQTIEGIEFPAIAQVQEELNRIGNQIDTNNPLLNQEFTEAQIRQKLQQGNFSAIHWKTHGIFSSDPSETFIVAYQQSIKANELQSLVQTASRDGQKPLELLVLSACETAKGDSRAVLGLAGLTVKTGARTALSTLWRADDRATTLLMTEFYQQLQQPGMTKAKALQKAQLSLIREEGYFAPYFWGTYVLVGNWL